MLLLFIGISIISIIKNIILDMDYSFIICDFIKNINYYNIYNLLARYIIARDVFIITLAPIIISDVVLTMAGIYKYSRLDKLDTIIKILFFDLIKLFLICFTLF